MLNKSFGILLFALGFFGFVYFTTTRRICAGTVNAVASDVAEMILCFLAGLGIAVLLLLLFFF